MMKTIKKRKKDGETITWEEQSGLLNFLQELPREVDAFNEAFEFGIHQIINPPAAIDGKADRTPDLGFVLIRINPLLPEVTYCLYSLLNNRVLQAFIGIYTGDDITTLKELKPVKDFTQGKAVLYDWMRQLVRASCEKIMP